MKILKFYADWCQPCKALSKVMEDIDIKYPVSNINIDDERGHTAAYYGIRSVPTLLVIDENENIVKRIVGSRTKEQLIEELTLE